jgi:hypothetical protein
VRERRGKKERERDNKRGEREKKITNRRTVEPKESEPMEMAFEAKKGSLYFECKRGELNQQRSENEMNDEKQISFFFKNSNVAKNPWSMIRFKKIFSTKK